MAWLIIATGFAFYAALCCDFIAVRFRLRIVKFPEVHVRYCGDKQHHKLSGSRYMTIGATHVPCIIQNDNSIAVYFPCSVRRRWWRRQPGRND
jgi:hypothetical protein